MIECNLPETGKKSSSFWNFFISSPSPNIPSPSAIKSALVEKERLIKLEKEKEDQRYERWRKKEIKYLNKKIPSLIYKIGCCLNSAEPRQLYEFVLDVCYDSPNNRYPIIQEVKTHLQEFLESKGWYLSLKVFDFFEYSSDPLSKFRVRLSYFSNCRTRYQILIAPSFFLKKPAGTFYQTPSPIFPEECCLICHDLSPNIIFDPCRHLILCGTCWEQLIAKEGRKISSNRIILPKCPKCRYQITVASQATDEQVAEAITCLSQ